MGMNGIGIIPTVQDVPEVKNPKLNKSLKEDVVKNHLEIILLSILSEGPMCGYDLIKEIFARYNVLLSQGTIYPLLYFLKEEGILQAKFLKGNMRTKRYSLTREGRQIIERTIGEFIEAEECFLNSIRKGYCNKGEPYLSLA